MIDMLKFVEEAKTKTLVKLDSDIKVNAWMLMTPVWPYFLIQYIIEQLFIILYLRTFDLNDDVWRTCLHGKNISLKQHKISSRI